MADQNLEASLTSGPGLQEGPLRMFTGFMIFA